MQQENIPLSLGTNFCGSCSEVAFAMLLARAGFTIYKPTKRVSVLPHPALDCALLKATSRHPQKFVPVTDWQSWIC